MNKTILEQEYNHPTIPGYTKEMSQDAFLKHKEKWYKKIPHAIPSIDVCNTRIQARDGKPKCYYQKEGDQCICDKDPLQLPSGICIFIIIGVLKVCCTDFTMVNTPEPWMVNALDVVLWVPTDCNSVVI